MSESSDEIPLAQPAPVIAYATPMQYQSPAVQSIWQQGKDLIVRKDVILPDICVKCGAPSTHRYVKSFSWIHPAWILLFLISWIILLIIYLIIRKTGKVSLGLCDEHRARRRRWIGIVWITSLSAVATLIAGIAMLSERRTEAIGGWCILGFGLLLIASLIMGMGPARLVYARKIDNHFIWLRGVTADFSQWAVPVAPPPLPASAAQVQVAGIGR